VHDEKRVKQGVERVIGRESTFWDPPMGSTYPPIHVFALERAVQEWKLFACKTHGVFCFFIPDADEVVSHYQCEVICPICEANKDTDGNRKVLCSVGANRISNVEAFLGMPRYMLAWLSDLRGGAVPFAFLECSHGRC